MVETLAGLVPGIVLIFLANGLLVRYSRLSARQAAILVALIIVGAYVPYALWHWPGADWFALHLAGFLLASLGCGILFRARDSAGDSHHWGPAVISGFFVLVAISGILFAIVAERGLAPAIWQWLLPESESGRRITSVFPGVISHDFHQKEALYNDYLQQVEAQRQRGWQIRKGWLRDPIAGQPTIFRVAVQGRDGQPITGAEIAGEFLRPSDSRQDVPFNLAETAPGVYETTLALPLAGRWNLVLRVRKGEDLHEIRAATQLLARQAAP